MLATKPTKVVELAVKGMLPHNRLGRKMFKKLKVYAGPEHPHAASATGSFGTVIPKRRFKIINSNVIGHEVG